MYADARRFGVEATVDNINAGTYMVSRPFILAANGAISAVAQNFIQYILSSEGQAIVKETGYIQVEPAGAYQPGGHSGKITIAESTSVSPVMEKLPNAPHKNPQYGLRILPEIMDKLKYIANRNGRSAIKILNS